MYIKKVKINNIRSIKDFEISFDKPAGWHVLIGDNGSGKTTILRAIAVGMIGKTGIASLVSDWSSWLRKGEQNATLEFEGTKWSKTKSGTDYVRRSIKTKYTIHLEDEIYQIQTIDEKKPDFWTTKMNNFAVGFGAFRRFKGGSKANDELYKSKVLASQYLTLFKEDASLCDCTDWLKDIHHKSLENDENAKKVLKGVTKLFEIDDFLPNNSKIEKISSDGIFFKGNDGNVISIDELSEGAKSVLSMTFELIKILHFCFSTNEIFEFIESENPHIACEGVVLIDEIDAHLHPSWQTKIGEWFTKIFPKIQFIVSTHSPLICRAAANGSIWRLPSLGTDEKVEQIVGDRKERLIYGNVLDAYGTELFGNETVRSQQSNEKLQRLGELNMYSALGKISVEEEKERLKLQQILSTDAPTGF